MRTDKSEYDFVLTNDFFAAIEAPEIQKGHLTVHLSVRKTVGVYVLDFTTEGTVIVPCDRCLDDMEIEVRTTDTLKVKLGANFSDENDIVVVPEEDGYINVAWFLYEFIALHIPMKHVHDPGKCNRQMAGVLRKHLRLSDSYEDGELDYPNDNLPSLEDDADTDPRWDELKKILNNN